MRFHGLLCDDAGTCVLHQQQRFIDSFYNADAIVDCLLSIGVRPFVEVSFMPEALASGCDTVFHYWANVTPPRDPRAWAGLVRRLAAHWVERYGIEEVRRWYFEVWNEPNLRAFWTGTRDDYFTLYRHAAAALKEVDPGLRVGGPATAKNEWLPEFLDFCARERLPADFVSTHHYPNDPLWSEAQDTESELAGSRRGILRESAAAAKSQACGLPLLYTEWNVSSNPRYPRQDDPYAAAFVVKSVLEVSGLVEAYSFWTFTDIREENYFPSVPFHGGFVAAESKWHPCRLDAPSSCCTNSGTSNPAVTGAHETVDAWAVRGGDELMLLLTNHALPRQPTRRSSVMVEIEVSAGCPWRNAATDRRRPRQCQGGMAAHGQSGVLETGRRGTTRRGESSAQGSTAVALRGRNVGPGVDAAGARTRCGHGRLFARSACGVAPASSVVGPGLMDG